MVLFMLAAAPSLLALLLGNGWIDAIWWAETAGVAWLVYAVEQWRKEEMEGIRSLENMRYEAKGA